MKLGKRQLEALRALYTEGRRSAYPGLDLRSLERLQTHGLVRSDHGRGSMFSPETAILWSLTDAGCFYFEQLGSEP